MQNIGSRCVALSSPLHHSANRGVLFEALGKDNIPPFQAPSQAAAPVPGCVSCKTAIAVIASPPA